MLLVDNSRVTVLWQKSQGRICSHLGFWNFMVEWLPCNYFDKTCHHMNIDLEDNIVNLRQLISRVIDISLFGLFGHFLQLTVYKLLLSTLSFVIKTKPRMGFLGTFHRGIKWAPKQLSWKFQLSTFFPGWHDFLANAPGLKENIV